MLPAQSPTPSPGGGGYVSFFSAPLPDNLSYIRLGALTAENLRELDQAGLGTHKDAALIVDLRATGEEAGGLANEYATRLQKSNSGGPLLVLIDEGTRDAGESLARLLKTRGDLLFIGSPSAHGEQNGISPDVTVAMAPAQKNKAFALAQERGLSATVDEAARPHFNEAALMAGTNPEAESRGAGRNEGESVHDAVLQRAVDIAISLSIFAKR